MRFIIKLITGIIAAALALIIAVCSVGWIYVAALQPILDQEALHEYLEDADLSQLTQSLNLGGDNILSSILTSLLQSDAARDVAEDYLSGYVMYLLRNGKEWNCTQEQIEALSRAAADAASRATNGFTDLFGDLTQSGMEVAVRAALSQLPAYSQINLGMDDTTLQLMRNLLSPDMLMVFVMLVIAAMLLIALFRWSFRESLLFGGLGLLLAGGYAIVTSFLIPEKISAMLAGSPLADMANHLVGDFATNSLLTGAYAAIGGLVLVVFYSLWSKKRKKKLRAAASGRRKNSHAA